MVHRFLNEAEKIKAGISPYGWRVSVGSEKAEDIIHDLEMVMNLMMDKKYREKIKILKKHCRVKNH